MFHPIYVPLLHSNLAFGGLLNLQSYASRSVLLSCAHATVNVNVQHVEFTVQQKKRDWLVTDS